MYFHQAVCQIIIVVMTTPGFCQGQLGQVGRSVTQCAGGEFLSTLCRDADEVIQVQRAVYGDYKSHEWCRRCCPTAEDCFTDIQQVNLTYYTKILAKCDGARYCEGLQAEIPGSVIQVGECRGRPNYVTIHYACVRGNNTTTSTVSTITLHVETSPRIVNQTILGGQSAPLTVLGLGTVIGASLVVAGFLVIIVILAVMVKRNRSRRKPPVNRSLSAAYDNRTNEAHLTRNLYEGHATNIPSDYLTTGPRPAPGAQASTMWIPAHPTAGAGSALDTGMCADKSGYEPEDDSWAQDHTYEAVHEEELSLKPNTGGYKHPDSYCVDDDYLPPIKNTYH